MNLGNKPPMFLLATASVEEVDLTEDTSLRAKLPGIMSLTYMRDRVTNPVKHVVNVLHHLVSCEDRVLVKADFHKTRLILCLKEDQYEEYIQKLNNWCYTNTADDGHYHGFKDAVKGDLPEQYRKLIAWVDTIHNVVIFRSSKEGEKTCTRFLRLLQFKREVSENFEPVI